MFSIPKRAAAGSALAAALLLLGAYVFLSDGASESRTDSDRESAHSAGSAPFLATTPPTRAVVASPSVAIDPSGDQESRRVVGRVIDAINSEGVRDVPITLVTIAEGGIETRVRTVSDGAGGFLFTEVGEGQADVWALAPGTLGVCAHDLFSSIRGRAATVTLVIGGEGSLEGQVLDSSTGNPIPGAVVTVTCRGCRAEDTVADPPAGASCVIGSATTDTFGRFTISGLSRNRYYSLNAQKLGWVKLHERPLWQLTDSPVSLRMTQCLDFWVRPIAAGVNLSEKRSALFLLKGYSSNGSIDNSYPRLTGMQPGDLSFRITPRLREPGGKATWPFQLSVPGFQALRLDLRPIDPSAPAPEEIRVHLAERNLGSVDLSVGPGRPGPGIILVVNDVIAPRGDAAYHPYIVESWDGQRWVRKLPEGRYRFLMLEGVLPAEIADWTSGALEHVITTHGREQLVAAGLVSRLEVPVLECPHQEILVRDVAGLAIRSVVVRWWPPGHEERTIAKGHVLLKSSTARHRIAIPRTGKQELWSSGFKPVALPVPSLEITELTLEDYDARLDAK